MTIEFLFGGDTDLTNLSAFELFDPNNCDQRHMNELAEILEEWLNVVEPSMIIPDDIVDDIGESVKEGKRRIRKLISKLRKGDKSVFVDDDEYSDLY